MSDQEAPHLRISDDPFDRRQAGNSSVQWVRDAFKEQNLKIDQVAADVREISIDLKKSWRNGDPATHWDEHELFKEREAERQRLEAAREVERAERAEFIKSIKKEALSWGIKAFAAFVLGVFILGGQEQFKQAVRWAVGSENAQEVKK
jgi:hypothetical protein